MAKRVCAVCCREKEVRGGAICIGGHFICSGDIYIDPGPLAKAKRQTCPEAFFVERTECPSCKQPLSKI